jgi:hypothetical protein
MQTALRVLSMTGAALLLAAAPALAKLATNHNETLVRDGGRMPKSR